jgi:hypothetical protein
MALGSNHKADNFAIYELTVQKMREPRHFTTLRGLHEARVRFPTLPEKKKAMGLEWGPLSLVSTTEELLDRKVEAPV